MLANPHVRAVSKISAGVGLAQLIAFAATPLLTRLYDPSDYGSMAVFAAIVAILAAVATGRFDAAIPLPPETTAGEKEALGLLRLALMCACALCCTAMVVAVLILTTGMETPLSDLGPWLLAVPLGALLGATSSSLYSYSTRRREYGVIARVAPAQRVGSSALMIGFGVLGAGRSGLILGSLLSPLFGLVAMGKVLRSSVRAEFPMGPGFQRGDSGRIARKYSDFPRHNLPFALLNALAWNVQVLVIGVFYPAAAVGQYALAFTAISLPASLIIAGVNQVFLRESAGLADEREGSLRFARRTLAVLGLVSAAVFPLMMLVAPTLFPMIFGDDWMMAGALAVAISPLLWARFLGTTISGVFVVHRRQGQLLIWQIGTLAATLGVYLLGGNAGWTLVAVTWCASLVLAPFYLLLIPWGLRVIRHSQVRIP